MQESMEDAIAAESEFHRYNSENHRLVNQNVSKNRPEIQGKIQVAQLTFNPVKTVHKIAQNSTNSRSPPIFRSEFSTNILILSLYGCNGFFSFNP